MCYEEMKSIKVKLLKILLGLALIVTIFGLNSIDAIAGSCSHLTCPCKGLTNSCASPYPCVIPCPGHDWRPERTEWSAWTTVNEITRTCTRNGVISQTRTGQVPCTRCSQHLSAFDSRTISGGSATGHNWSNWEWYGSYSQHRKTCTNSWHNTGVDGDKYQYESHNLNSEHQHNDWKWHQDCTTYACNHDDIRWGYNDGTVTFHYGYDSGTTSRSANTNSSITSPVGTTTAGRTLVGWNKRTSSVQTYNVQQVPGASLASWSWNLNSAKSVKEVVPGAQNSRYASDNAAAVWEWNHVRIHYRAGYNTDGTGTGLTKDNFADYVDYTQDLDSRKIDQFTRTGYDIITKGWFTTKTNEGTYTHHVDAIGDAVCTDTPAYVFNKNYKASEWSTKVLTQHTTDVYIYPHWRAHVLHVNYNTNGGVTSTGQSGIIETATWYYDDGKSGDPQRKYYLTNTVPTKAGYVFMGWGNTATWSQERYTRQIANESTGTKVAYDNTQAKSVAKTAQDWSKFLGKDLTTGDQTVTFYAQWERVITYKFYYYNDEANKAYYYEGGYQDCNTASVAFHNDDDEYLWMDIYMKRCCKAAFSVQKDADSGFFLCEKLSRPSHYRWTIF